MIPREIATAFHMAATGIAVVNVRGRFVYANQAYCQMLGYTQAELFQLDFLSVTHPDDVLVNADENAAVLRGERRSAVFEKRYVRKDGSVVWGRLSMSAHRNDAGAIIGLLAIVEDITGLRQAGAEPLEAERSLVTLLSNLPGMVYRCRYDEHWTMLYLSDGVADLTGYTRDFLLNNGRLSYAELIHPDDRAMIAKEVAVAVASGRRYSFEYRLLRSDGSWVRVWEQGKAVPGADHSISLLEGYVTDISEQRAAEQRLLAAQGEATAILNAVGEGIFGVDTRGRITLVNPAAAALLDWPVESLKGANAHEIMHYVHRDGTPYPVRHCHVYSTLKDGQPRRIDNEVFFRSNGTFFPVEYVVSPIVAATGAIAGAVVCFSDIGPRLALEEQARRSQRLDSLGHLTGGVAHDFNNLLTVILGNAELLEESAGDDAHTKLMSGMIVNAAQRGAQLTQSLLAFARRQPLDPSVVNLQELVESSLQLLHRTLGEHISISLDTRGQVWPSLIDPALLEGALLNLAINSRDAMAGGGELRFELENCTVRHPMSGLTELKPGDYIRLSVADTGQGIPPEHMDHLFEPFFTTKEKGKGTGLGLPMVYGFVRQSGGYIHIDSIPGTGTTVTLYLPRALEASAGGAALETVADQPAVTRSAVILLVEDDAPVRLYVKRLLLAHGYKVIEAGNAAEALQVLDTSQHIDLLFTDVVMPGGLSGKELADRAAGIRPGLPVLFTSGYSESEIIHEGRLEDGVELLAKPYRKAELLQKVERVMQRRIHDHALRPSPKA